MEPTSLTFTVFASPRWDRFGKSGGGVGVSGTGNAGISKTESRVLLKGKGQC